MDRVALWVAQGFFIGRIPVAPGTFGSLLGLGWVAALLWTRNAWSYGAGTVLGLICSVWLCGRAERILRQTDPGSVVLDEVVAMPVCFAGWLGLWVWQHGHLPYSHPLFTYETSAWTAGIFAAFRFFDIAKPWPVRQSQALVGGWGVTIDDTLAALYVNLVVLAVWAVLYWRH